MQAVQRLETHPSPVLTVVSGIVEAPTDPVSAGWAGTLDPKTDPNRSAVFDVAKDISLVSNRLLRVLLCPDGLEAMAEYSPVYELHAPTFHREGFSRGTMAAIVAAGKPIVTDQRCELHGGPRYERMTKGRLNTEPKKTQPNAKPAVK